MPGAQIRWCLWLWAEPIVGGRLGRTCSDGFDKGEEGIQDGFWTSGLNNFRNNEFLTERGKMGRGGGGWGGLLGIKPEQSVVNLLNLR